MQTQDAPADVLFKLWPWFEANKQRLIIGVVVIGLIVAISTYVSSQREQKEIAAGEALTKLLFTTTPNSAPQMAAAFAKVATEYSGTAAAQRAQLQAGAALFSAGQYPEAQAQFQKFLADNAAGQLAATAQLGMAASLEAQGKPDAADAYQKVVANYPGTTSAEVAKQSLTRFAKPVAAPVAPAVVAPAK